MSVVHTKNWGLYHWDSLANMTMLIDEADTLGKAESIIRDRFVLTSNHNGDHVKIIHLDGTAVRAFFVR